MINRGHQREPILREGSDRLLFLETVGDPSSPGCQWNVASDDVLRRSSPEYGEARCRFGLSALMKEKRSRATVADGQGFLIATSDRSLFGARLFLFEIATPQPAGTGDCDTELQHQI